jgi:septum site-determining protein MinC
MAFVLRPEPPLADWVAALDAQLARSPSFFEGRPVILDLAELPPHDAGAGALVTALRERGIRVVDVDNFEGEVPGIERWGVGLAGAKTGEAMSIPDDPEPPPPPPPPQETGMVIAETIRSGQVVAFPHGDLTVLGSVASGAEVMAGGSIHIYGALRGRAIAGALGNGRAQIFCHKLEAELVAIDGFYRTAEDMDPALRRRAARVWLDGGAIQVAALD